MNYQLFKAIHNLSGHSFILDEWMKFFTNYSLIIYGLSLLLILIIGKKKSKRTAIYALGAGLLALALNFVITKFYYEPRPFVAHHVHLLLPHAKDASFPSDNASVSFSIAFAVWLRNRKIGIPMIGLAILNGISRVWVGHHYPLDIVGSIIVAIIVTIIVSKLEQYLNQIKDAKGNYKKSI